MITETEQTLKILVTDPLAASATAELRKEFEVVEQHYSPMELLNEIGKYHGIIVRSATKLPREVIEAGTNLKVIGRAGIGVDNIDIQAATERRIIVVNAPRSSSISVAELTMAYMLALSCSLVHFTNDTKSNKNPKKYLQRTELYGKTIGCIGCGKIGSEVIARTKVFGMKATIYSPNLPSEIAKELGVEKTNDLDRLLRTSDYVTIHTKLRKDTHGLIGKRELELMKPTAFLINCARGGIIDEDALYKALRENWIAGAALDVFTNEPVRNNKLLELDNIYVSPHIGATTTEAQERVGQVIVEQVRLALMGQEPDYVVKESYFTG
ncbi:MAG: hydroxyacid dehydrogenase [Candidatus Hodarchaeales archaeon]|jgi:D-3-phosphoglycerate dehydrogenase